MRRCLVHHPRWYAGARPVRLRNDDELDAAIGESPDYQYGLAAPGMERIVDPPLDRVFVGSLSLFREEVIPLASCLYGGKCRVHVFNAQLSRSERSLETPSMHVDRAFARLGLASSPKQSVMLVKEPQAGADGGEYRARKVLGCAAHTL